MARMVRKAIDGYFKDLDGEKPCAVYDMVINASRSRCSRSCCTACAATRRTPPQMLGINRNTLRKKMRVHGIKF